MGRVREISRNLKAYDKELYAQCNKPPRIDVYRQNRDKLSPPHFVFSLTENWTPTGKPVEWGIEVILARLKAIDLWGNGQTADQLNEANAKIDESRERTVRNNIEGFVSEFRSQFAKATDGIRVANMKKLYRKENSNGYCEPRSGFVAKSS